MSGFEHQEVSVFQFLLTCVPKLCFNSVAFYLNRSCSKLDTNGHLQFRIVIILGISQQKITLTHSTIADYNNYKMVQGLVLRLADKYAAEAAYGHLLLNK